MNGAPLKRFRVQPVPGSVTEHRVPGGTWCLELEQGAQVGVRLGFDPIADRLTSIPFDGPDVSVPADGAERFYLHWPSSADATLPLEFTAWTVPAKYYRRGGGPAHAQPLAQVLFAEKRTWDTSTVFGPFTYLPASQVVAGASLRLPHGARLCAYFGTVGGAGVSGDVTLEIEGVGGGGFEMVDGQRGAGVPSLPVSVFKNTFDVPAPLGEFQFEAHCAGLGNITRALGYLLLGP